jgi:hypothetical protein
MNNNLSLNDPLDFLSHRFIRLGLTGPKALQTVSLLSSEIHRRYAVSKSNVFTLYINIGSIDINDRILYVPLIQNAR